MRAGGGGEGRSHINIRSANTRTLVLHWTKTAVSTREFAVSAAVVWNSPWTECTEPASRNHQ